MLLGVGLLRVACLVVGSMPLVNVTGDGRGEGRLLGVGFLVVQWVGVAGVWKGAADCWVPERGRAGLAGELVAGVRAFGVVAADLKGGQGQEDGGGVGAWSLPGGCGQGLWERWWVAGASASSCSSLASRTRCFQGSLVIHVRLIWAWGIRGVLAGWVRQVSGVGGRFAWAGMELSGHRKPTN